MATPDLVDKKYYWYLYEVMQTIVANAKSRPVGSAGSDYDAGYRMAYYEVVSLLKQTAEGFQIPLQDLPLDSIDPDRDLI